ncbi:guanylate kinase [Bacteroides acidifaciens]|uniref:guanylate kinase n=1 Tax=Bacteroides acidifaciens TaxID=85831 RepID=UPI00271541EA|nr:guanylate kinase [Bacteroides acidifaciens]HRF86184.1 guanylate kinase [Alloprevotella sp.]
MEQNKTIKNPIPSAITRKGKVLIFSAPSGSGKSTLINQLIASGLQLHFSISATSRQPRGSEQDGVEYYFISPEEFRKRIAAGEFLEYEEVYKDKYYGTLKSEVDRNLDLGRNIICDIDVLGARNIKKYYQDQSLSIFIQPPSIEALRQRLENRGTESPEAIDQRLERAEFEISFAPEFDVTIINDNLEKARQEVLSVVKAFLQK